VPDSQAAMQYWGQGFSPRGEKNRFVLPSDFRADIRTASGGQRVLCLDKHPRLPAMVGFGTDRPRYFHLEMEEEKARCKDDGEVFSRELFMAQLSGFRRANFDESGRFVLPSYLSEMTAVEGGLYFHGGGNYFTIWPPEVLFAMPPGWDTIKASCRAKMAETLGKDRRK
jgi:MraZ protein